MPGPSNSAGNDNAHSVDAVDLKTVALLLEHAPDHILLVNADGLIQYLNYSLPGHPASSVVGKSVWDYTASPESRRLLRDAMSAVFQGRGPVSYQGSATLPNGEVRWYLTRVSAVIVNQAIVGAALIATDNTEQKRAELDLARSHAEFQDLIATIPFGVAITAEDKVLYLNRAFAKLLSCRVPEAWLGRPFSDLFDAEAHPVIERLTKQEAIDGQRPLEVTLTNPDGSSACLDLLPAGHMHYAGTQALLIVARDVTKTRGLQRQLVQAQKLEAIGQLAAGVAHEINTPIQYIGDNLAFLADAFRDVEALSDGSLRLAAKVQRGEPCVEEAAQVASQAEAADFAYLRTEIPRAVQQAREGVEQVTRIVRAMKDFSHPGVEDPIETDINHALESTIAVARNEWKHVADVVTELDPVLPTVKCLPGDLNQVFLNVLVNAAHAIAEVVGHSGDKGVITVRTRHLEPDVEIEIEDTGCGIPPEIADRIYDPFFTTKEVGKGTGQGLLIAHQVVVEKHQGRLFFESSRKGTVFHIRLPRDAARTSHSPQEAA